MIYNIHWRQSALNSAGALQGVGGEFGGIFTPFYTIDFRGGHKSVCARAIVASASLAPLIILQLSTTIIIVIIYTKTKYFAQKNQLILFIIDHC